MKTLLIAEKPALGKRLIDVLPESYQIDEWIAIPPYGVLSFDIPRDLPLSGVPFVKSPQYKINFNSIIYGSSKTTAKLHNAFNINLDNHDHALNELKRFIEGYDVVYFAMDADHTGQFGSYQFLASLGIDFYKPNHVHIRIYALDDDSILQEMARVSQSPSVNHTEFERFINMAKIKRKFDYLWHINSLPISSVLMKRLNLPQGFTLTKNHLQVLMRLENEVAATRIEQILMWMQRYRGTGKYPLSTLGSVASRMPILEQLTHASLLTMNDSDNNRKSHTGQQSYEITEKGRALLGMCHPKFKDSDLPGRLTKWMDDQYLENATFDQTSAVMERYIKTLFGKQKNFLNKIRDNIAIR